MPGFAVGTNVYRAYRTGTILVDLFMVHLEKTCEKHGIELHLTDGERVVYGGTTCTGYFDPRLRRLALAMGGHHHGGGPAIAPWLPTLVHEFAHMTQWIDQCDAWKEMCFDDSGLVDSEMVIDLWLNRHCELTDEQLNRHLKAARGVEVDCEQRVLKLIDKFNLPIEKADYARSANAYAYFWTTIQWTRKWYSKRPYSQPEILDLMPTSVHDNDFYDEVPSNIKELILDLCYDKEVTVEGN